MYHLSSLRVNFHFLIYFPVAYTNSKPFLGNNSRITVCESWTFYCHFIFIQKKHKNTTLNAKLFVELLTRYWNFCSLTWMSHMLFYCYDFQMRNSCFMSPFENCLIYNMFLLFMDFQKFVNWILAFWAEWKCISLCSR